MAPNTRRTKAPKALKENNCVLKSKKVKSDDQNVKPRRKPLADKTNSASDDNTSILVETNIKNPPLLTKTENVYKSDLRPRRVKKVPIRYHEYTVQNTSNNKESCNEVADKTSQPKNKSPERKKVPIVLITPIKVKSLDNSLVKNRPKRICKLPTKFEDHSISPNKFIPLQPINASTPIVNKSNIKNKENTKKVQSKKINTKSTLQSNENNTRSKQRTIKTYLTDKSIVDENNVKNKEQMAKSTPKKSEPRILHNRTPEDNNTKKKPLKRDSSKVDVYEFTYDPNEEPPPAKKKKKKTVKKPAKPKAVKSTYDKNLAKALAALKSTVSNKLSKPEVTQKDLPIANDKSVKKNDYIDVASTNKQVSNINKSIVNAKNYNSVRIEDIASAMQPDVVDNIDYSPVNSPSHPKSPVVQNPKKPNDPLNLNDISFFDDNPVASSSMNASIRDPLASPWRVEFGSLPIKWQVNTYVKPNMTPALESSFINFTDSQKKHVYTNILPVANDSLPQALETPKLKQTSIISFIKEVVERSASKKKKSKATPVKANSLFEDTNISVTVQSPDKSCERSNKNITHEEINKSNDNKADSIVKGNAEDNNKNNKSDENDTYFGFDESEDQENVSPKKKNRMKSLRARTRGILQELNEQKGPMRAAIPISAKSKPLQNSDAMNELFDGMKSATEPPVFPETGANGNTEVTVTETTSATNMENDDSQSVHLFEDIDIVHHLKPIRKSYSKPKRVMFRKNSMDSDTSPHSDIDNASSDEDLDDLSFKLPSVKPKKNIKKKKTLSKKQKLSKKEEQEADAWAAGFNSMCEDIEEFDLVVE